MSFFHVTIWHKYKEPKLYVLSKKFYGLIVSNEKFITRNMALRNLL